MQSDQEEPPSTPILATAPPKSEELPSGLDDVAALLQTYSSIPSLSKAWAFPPSNGSDGVRVALQLSQRNLPANAQRKYLTHFPLNEAVLEAGEADTSLPTELTGTTMVSFSPSGKRMLIARSPSENATSTILEIWDRSRVLNEIHVPTGLHGSVYNDGWFGNGAAWSPDESRIAYVAEAPVAVKTPEWSATLNTTTKNNGKKNEGAAAKGWRGVSEYEEDWGELNTGKRPPTLFVLETCTGIVSAVQSLPKDTSSGQPQWSPDGSALLFVSWEHSPSNFPNFSQRLGIVYCFNRPCALHAVVWPQPEERGTAPAALRLTPLSLSSAFSPRFSPDGSTLVMLSQAAAVESGVHSATPTLLAMSWTDVIPSLTTSSNSSTTLVLPSPRRVVDIVWNPADSDTFPGLYCNVLPEQPFVGGSTTLVTTVAWRSNTAVVAVDVETGAVLRITPNNGSSWSLLAVQQDWMLVTESHPGQPFKLFACHIADSQRGQPSSWSWSRVVLPDTETLPEVVTAALSQLETQTLQLTPTVGPTDVPLEAVIIKRKDLKGPLPTVLTPHGGPHSNYAASYFMPLSFLAASGYCIVLVNYRGSTGFGESSIQSLPGSIGTNDVADCMAALNAAVAAGAADPQRIAAVGGSHGGFLSAHLVGQHPDSFRAVVLRNPVCNISLMVHLSDISDWCYVEGLGTEQGRARAQSGPSQEDSQRFFEVSPIRYVDAVTAPMLMMLGSCDRRVPQDDGKRYLEALRKRSDAPETRLLVFPKDTHALDKPQTEFEQWVNVVGWLRKHMV